MVSTARAGSKGDVDEDDGHQQESESRHRHQAGVGDLPGALRLDASDGRKSGDEDGEAEPCEPGHMQAAYADSSAGWSGSVTARHDCDTSPL